MQITVIVTHVDGESYSEFTSPDAKGQLARLRAEDHEGASVAVVVKTYDEQAYRLLEALAGVVN